MRDYFKLPRIRCDKAEMEKNTQIVFEDESTIQRIIKVLRKRHGDRLRLFNSKEEWLAEISEVSKKNFSVMVKSKLRNAPASSNKKTILAFSPIKPSRLQLMIEKATELGTNEFQPVITQNCNFTKLNKQKIQDWIYAASIQSERFDIPNLATSINLGQFIANTNAHIIFCDEHADTSTKLTPAIANDAISLLVGPEGGFTEIERNLIQQSSRVTTISLGDNILRSETAAIAALSIILLT